MAINRIKDFLNRTGVMRFHRLLNSLINQRFQLLKSHISHTLGFHHDKPPSISSQIIT